MHVTLEPVIWDKLTAFDSADAFLRWMDEDDEESIAPSGHSLETLEWISDDAGEYMKVAQALQSVARSAPARQADALNQGIRRLICVDDHVDDFGTRRSNRAYWLSASPATATRIQLMVDGTDWRLVTEQAREAAHGGVDITRIVNQHRAVLKYAVNHGFGLLGHCG